MQPALRHGQVVLVNRWVYLFSKPQIGDITLFRNPKNTKQLFCKRIAAINREKKEVYMVGDNAQDSLDSRQLGTIKLQQIVGRVASLSAPLPNNLCI